MSLKESQERFALGSNGKELRAWHQLSIEEKKEHRRKVRLFRKALYEQHVYEALTVSELAQKYKITPTYVRCHIQMYVSQQAKKKEVDIPGERLDQYHKLKELINATYPRALSGNDFAIKSFVSLSARFSKVIGLDAPTRFQHDVNRKTSHTITHEINLEELEKRIALVRQRQALLEQSKSVATPISDVKSEELVPVSNVSAKKALEDASISPTSGSQSTIDAEYVVEVPETLAPESHTMAPTPEPSPEDFIRKPVTESPKAAKYSDSVLRFGQEP